MANRNQNQSPPPASAPAATAAPAAIAPKEGFKRVRHVTLPTLQVKDDTSRLFKFDTQVFEGKERIGRNGEKEKPARVAGVTDVETGEVGQIVLGTMLESNLTEKYPNHSYVGKTFEVIKYAKRDKERYNRYELFEVVPEGQDGQ